MNADVCRSLDIVASITMSKELWCLYLELIMAYGIYFAGWEWFLDCLGCGRFDAVIMIYGAVVGWVEDKWSLETELF